MECPIQTPLCIQMSSCKSRDNVNLVSEKFYEKDIHSLSYM